MVNNNFQVFLIQAVSGICGEIRIAHHARSADQRVGLAWGAADQSPFVLSF